MNASQNKAAKSRSTAPMRLADWTGLPGNHLSTVQPVQSQPSHSHRPPRTRPLRPPIAVPTRTPALRPLADGIGVVAVLIVQRGRLEGLQLLAPFLPVPFEGSQAFMTAHGIEPHRPTELRRVSSIPVNTFSTRGTTSNRCPGSRSLRRSKVLLPVCNDLCSASWGR